MGTGHENPRLKIGFRDNFQNGSNSHLFQHGKMSLSAKFHAFITFCTIHSKICFYLLHYNDTKERGSAMFFADPSFDETVDNKPVIIRMEAKLDSS